MNSRLTYRNEYLEIRNEAICAVLFDFICQGLEYDGDIPYGLVRSHFSYALDCAAHEHLASLTYLGIASF